MLSALTNLRGFKDDVREVLQLALLHVFHIFLIHRLKDIVKNEKASLIAFLLGKVFDFREALAVVFY